MCIGLRATAVAASRALTKGGAVPVVRGRRPRSALGLRASNSCCEPRHDCDDGDLENALQRYDPNVAAHQAVDNGGVRRRLADLEVHKRLVGSRMPRPCTVSTAMMTRAAITQPKTG